MESHGFLLYTALYTALKKITDLFFHNGNVFVCLRSGNPSIHVLLSRPLLAGSDSTNLYVRLFS